MHVKWRQDLLLCAPDSTVVRGALLEPLRENRVALHASFQIGLAENSTGFPKLVWGLGGELNAMC